MFSYDKFLQRPIKIRNKNPQLASLIATQYGGAYCNCLSENSLFPKHDFKLFPIASTLGYFLKNRPCYFVFFNIVYFLIF